MTKTFTYNGCTVKVFRSSDDTMRWCLQIGTNIYGGFKTRVAAVSAVGNYI